MRNGIEERDDDDDDDDDDAQAVSSPPKEKPMILTKGRNGNNTPTTPYTPTTPTKSSTPITTDKQTVSLNGNFNTQRIFVMMIESTSRSPFLYIPNMIGYLRLILVLVGLHLMLPSEESSKDRTSPYILAYNLFLQMSTSLLVAKSAVMHAFGISNANGTRVEADKIIIGALLYCTGFLLDGVDGFVARLLNQVIRLSNE